MYEEAGDDLITIYLEFNTVTSQQRTLTHLSNFYILLELHDCLLFVVITHHTYVNNNDFTKVKTSLWFNKQKPHNDLTKVKTSYWFNKNKNPIMISQK